MNESPQLEIHSDTKRYELATDGLRPFMDYAHTEDKIFLLHTEVPDEKKGKGFGTQLVKAVLHDIERMDLRLIPLCPFVAVYIKRNPEWLRLVMDDVSIIEK